MAGYNILLVDDELSNLNALERTLRHDYGASFNVYSATNGQDALVIIEQQQRKLQPIALIISDHRMPGMTGVELLERVLQKYPDTVRIILTAYTNETLLMDAINTGHVYGYITKPWEPEDIMGIVRDGIRAYEITSASRELYTRTLLHSGIISVEQLDNALQIQRTERKPIGEILVSHGIVSRSQLDMATARASVAQASNAPEATVGGKQLEDVLIQLGIVTFDDLEMAREFQKYERRRLSEILVELGYTDEESIFSCYALQLGIPYVAISQFPSKPGVVEIMPSELSLKYTVFPVDAVGKVLVIASPEPLSDAVRREIEDVTGYKVMVLCASHWDVESAIEQSYRKVMRNA